VFPLVVMPAAVVNQGELEVAGYRNGVGLWALGEIETKTGRSEGRVLVCFFIPEVYYVWNPSG
jgi:hypothetical protein